MRLLFNYLLLTTCILLLRVGVPVVAADGDHPSIQSSQDHGDLNPEGFGLGVPVEEEVELDNDKFQDISYPSQRVKSLDLRAKFSELGHGSSCSRAGLAGNPHLRLEPVATQSFPSPLMVRFRR